MVYSTLLPFSLASFSSNSLGTEGASILAPVTRTMTGCDTAALSSLPASTFLGSMVTLTSTGMAGWRGSCCMAI